MKTVINISSVTDHSGEPPIVTYSNPVTTVIDQAEPHVIISRYFYCFPCDCCSCDCCRTQTLGFFATR